MFKSWFARFDRSGKAQTLASAIAEFKQSEHWGAVRTCPTETGLEELLKWVRNGE